MGKLKIDYKESLLNAQTYIAQLEKDIDYLKKCKQKIIELQKENAVLKSEKGCETCTKFDEVKLTKAKEIIKDLLEHNKEHWLYSDIKKQAEQFLKEIEK